MSRSLVAVPNNGEVVNCPTVTWAASDRGDKGENAIIEQEEKLRAMSAADIEQQTPAFKACFDWIRSL